MRGTLALKFGVSGDVRFLSHQEILRIFQRALIRAQIPVSFSEGFNPHPRISIPLPRSVGVESDGEVIVIGIELDEQADTADLAKQYSQSIGEALAAGMEVLDSVVVKGKVSLHADGAAYIIKLRSNEAANGLEIKAAEVIRKKASGEEIIITRSDEKGYSRDIELLQYIENITVSDCHAVVVYRITPAGSIRVEEIMQLLELDVSELGAPVKRTAVKWNTNIFAKV